jgi:hypothetical protein
VTHDCGDRKHRKLPRSNVLESFCLFCASLRCFHRWQPLLRRSNLSSDLADMGLVSQASGVCGWSI